MKKMIKMKNEWLIYGVLMCLLFHPVSVVGQIAGTKPLNFPNVFLGLSSYKGMDGFTYNENDVIKGKPWKVVIDGSGYRSYKGPSSSSGVKKYPNFLQNFYVASIKGKYFHIISDPDLNAVNLTFSPHAIDYGWIESSKLLLSPHCLLTPKGKVNVKAMLMNTFNSLKKGELKKPKSVGFFTDPELVNKSNKSSKIFEIFYVYKKTKKSYLLGKTENLSVSMKNSSVIYGWVDKDRLILWNHRIAIEPNWSREAIDERKREGIKPQIFLSQKQAEKYEATEKSQSDAFFENDDNQEYRNGRYLGEWRRFPLYRKVRGQNPDAKYPIYRVGVMGNIVSSKGIMNTLTKAKLDSAISVGNRALRKLNIVFVIDGTASMQPYLHAVSVSIRKTMSNLTDNFGNSKTLNILRFGALIYRDYADGSHLTESIPLSGNYLDVANRISRVQARDWGDKDEREAVFYGIKKALRLFNNPNESNLIILIGDAGNHHRNDPTQVDIHDLARLINAYHCHFLAFQVNNRANDSAYEEFIPEMKDLVGLYSKQAYDYYKKYDVKKILKGVPYFDQTKQSGFNELVLKNNPIKSKLIYPDPGSRMNAAELEKQIPGIVREIDNFTNDLLELSNQIVQSGVGIKKAVNTNRITKYSHEKASDFSPALVSYYARTGIPIEQLKKLMDNKTQMFQLGYTVLNMPKLSHPLFKRDVLMTRLELGALIQDINKLVNAKSFDRRQKMVDAWITILKDHIGDIKQQELMSKSMEEITRMLYDIPTNSAFLKGLRLRDIMDVKALPDNKFEQYVWQLEQKQERLQSIFNGENYKYMFYSYNNAYYWISEDLMP